MDHLGLAVASITGMRCAQLRVRVAGDEGDQFLERSLAAAVGTAYAQPRRPRGAVPASSLPTVDGYRQLLVDGAEAAHRAWLAALRRGLVGSTFAGLPGPDLDRLGGVDGYFCGGLLGLSLGLPRGGGPMAG